MDFGSNVECVLLFSVQCNRFSLHHFKWMHHQALTWFIAMSNMHVPISTASTNHQNTSGRKARSKHRHFWDCSQRPIKMKGNQVLIIDICIKMFYVICYFNLRQFRAKNACFPQNLRCSSEIDIFCSFSWGDRLHLCLRILKTPFQPDKFKQSNFRRSCTCSINVPPQKCLAGRQSFV